MCVPLLLQLSLSLSLSLSVVKQTNIKGSLFAIVVVVVVVALLSCLSLFFFRIPNSSSWGDGGSLIHFSLSLSLSGVVRQIVVFSQVRQVSPYKRRRRSTCTLS
jgi:hypothetical protein